MARDYKRRRTEPDDTGDTSDGEERQEMLKMLEAQISNNLGVEPIHATEEASDSSHDSHWSGISSGAEDQSLSDRDSEPDIVSYTHQKSATRIFDKADLKAFMSPSVSKLLKTDSTKEKLTKGTQQDDKEKEMQQLDTTLQALIATLPEQSSSTSMATIPRRINHTIQKNTPLPLRKALQKTRLKRVKAQAEDDRLSGAVKAKIRQSTQGPALTKKEMRQQSGQERDRRKKARGIAGSLGKVDSSGALRIGKAELQQTQAKMSAAAHRARASKKRKR